MSFWNQVFALLVPSHWGKVSSLGESGRVAPLLTSTLSPRRPCHARRQQCFTQRFSPEREARRVLTTTSDVGNVTDGQRGCGPPSVTLGGVQQVQALWDCPPPPLCSAPMGTGWGGGMGILPGSLPPPPPCVTFRLVVVSLRGRGQSPVLPFACCVGLLRSVGRCGGCSCWCRFRVCGAQWLVCRGCAGCGSMCHLRVRSPSVRGRRSCVMTSSKQNRHAQRAAGLHPLKGT